MQLFTSLNAFFSDATLRWYLDENRLGVVRHQLQDVLDFVNANVLVSLPSHSSPRWLLLFPPTCTLSQNPTFWPSRSQCAILSSLSSVLLSAANTQSVFQVVIQSYLFPLLLQDPQTVRCSLSVSPRRSVATSSTRSCRHSRPTTMHVQLSILIIRSRFSSPCCHVYARARFRCARARWSLCCPLTTSCFSVFSKRTSSHRFVLR